MIKKQESIKDQTITKSTNQNTLIWRQADRPDLSKNVNISGRQQGWSGRGPCDGEAGETRERDLRAQDKTLRDELGSGRDQQAKTFIRLFSHLGPTHKIQINNNVSKKIVLKQNSLNF